MFDDFKLFFVKQALKYFIFLFLQAMSDYYIKCCICEEEIKVMSIEEFFFDSINFVNHPIKCQNGHLISYSKRHCYKK